MARGPRTTRPGEGQVVWDHEMRTVIWLLFDGLKMTREPRTAIFNEVFKAELAGFNLPAGIKHSRLEAQFYEHKKRKAYWQVICRPRSTRAVKNERARLLQRIQTVAATLGYGLDGAAAPATRPTASISRPATTSEPRPASKRPAQSVATEEEYTPHTPVPKRRRIAAVVAVPNSVKGPQWVTYTNRRAVTPPKTPTSSRTPISRRPDATILYSLPGGNSVYLTPQEYEETEGELVPVSEAEAHPPLPPILFRYWTDGSQSRLTNGEFKAGRFRTTNIAPPPLPKLDSPHFPWSDVFLHLNRDPIDSPFISTSNFLLWIVRLAAKEAGRGVAGGRISLIDTSKLSRCNVLHVPPFHKALCKKRPFENGAHYYHGSHELMVYNKIPASAIIQTFSMANVIDLAQRDQAIGSVVRLDVLSLKGDYRAKLRPLLKKDSPRLTPAVITSIARVCRALGLSKQSRIEHISHIIEDFLYGWAYSHDRKDPEEWQAFASVFAQVFCRRSVPAANTQDVQKVKLAFLEGVKWSMGTYNTRHSAKSIANMQRKAIAVGLECPAKLISNELDAAKLQLWTYQRQQERLVESMSSATAPMAVGAPVTPGPSNRRAWRPVPGSSKRPLRMLMYEDGEAEGAGFEGLDGDEDDEIRYQ